MKSPTRLRLNSRQLLLLTVSAAAVLSLASGAFADTSDLDADAPMVTAGADASPSTPTAAGQAQPVQTPPYVSTPTPFPGPAIPPVTAPGVRLNPTGHDVALNGPLSSGGVILGEVGFTLGADDSIRVDASTLLQLARPILAPAKYAALAAAIGKKGDVRPSDIRALGYDIAYDAENISLDFTVPNGARTVQSLDLADRNQGQLGSFDQPARFTAYMTAQASVNYDWNGAQKGIADPLVLLNGAARYGPVVLESDQSLQGGTTNVFQRQGTRFVYDDLALTARFTLGDLLPTSRGFSGATPMSGVSIYRSYEVLDPQRNVQPLGNEAFTLAQPSTVQAYVNGILVRQIQLNPGTYNIHDFPFAQGSNKISLVITDGSGNRQTLNFSLNFDQTLLAPGIAEFGLYAGVLSPFSNTGPDYHFNQPAASGFYRRGITSDLTLGANFQAQRTGIVAGFEGTWASPVGTVTANVAASDNKGVGAGYAVNAQYSQTFNPKSSFSTGFTVTAETESVNFATPDALGLSPTTALPGGTISTLNDPNSPYEFEIDASITQGLWHNSYVSLEGQYSKGRAGNPDQTDVRLNYGIELTRQINLVVGAEYEDDISARGFGGTLSLVYRPNQRVTVQADADTLQNEEDVQATTTSQRVGAYSWTGDAEIIQQSGVYGFNGDFEVLGNRAELGLAQQSDFNGVNGQPPAQVTTARLASAIVFADGKFALSRPVYDSFAMIEPHTSLSGASVLVDRDGKDYLAKSDWLGPAVDPDLSSYSEHTENVDVPNAPPGYDLGTGSIRMYPPYHSGYLITVGSDYSVTAVGRLLDRDGAPIALLAGHATEVAAPKRAPVVLFTNRNGLFGATGLRPGKWIITMPTSPELVYEIEIPAKAKGVVRLGDEKPEN